MLILIGMLLIGSVAAVWGFSMSFLPERWERLANVMIYADRWTAPTRHRTRLQRFLRIGHQLAGVPICAVGCWFTYIAASAIYRSLSGDSVLTTEPAASGLQRSEIRAGALFFGSMLPLGLIMLVKPAAAIRTLERLWPGARRIEPRNAERGILAIRVLGVVVLIFAGMFFFH
jgi:hypothetical protein